MCIELTLEIIQTIAAAVAAGSVLFAYLSYRDNKKKDNRLAAINQVELFRREIIPAQENFVNDVRNKESDYKFARVKLDSKKAKDVKETFPEESRKQVNLLSILDDYSRQTQILNMLEELALKIKHFETLDHEALNSIKSTFVEIVEIHAIWLLTQRELLSGPPTYSTILEIYDHWKDIVDRRTPEQRLENIQSYILPN